MKTTIIFIMGLIGGYLLSIFQKAGKDTWDFIYSKYKLLKQNYNIYKDANKIINEYNKQKQIIKQYENDIYCYNLKYNQNKLEILEQKIKNTYGEEFYGDWWFDDNMKIKSSTRHNGKNMLLPYIEYNECIWKDMGELKIYKF